MPFQFCESCIFWKSDSGECRLHAPVVVNTTSERGSSVRPVTKSYDGCGDGEPIKPEGGKL